MLRDGFARKSPTRILEESLAVERRRVVSDWRAMLIFHRYAVQHPYSGMHRFREASKVRTLLRQLVEAGELAPLVPELHLYRVTSPYAQQDPILEWEILMEVNPMAAVSHYSALHFHQVTEDFPREHHLMRPGLIPDWYPVGTGEDDWDEVLRPSKHRLLSDLEGLPVHWHTVKRLQGIREYKPYGYPVRVTTLERTLLDGLLDPGWCGGIEKVLRAWMNSRDTLQIQQVVELVEDFDKPILRQRAGFLLEKLGLTHDSLDGWAGKAIRGGSSKLVADEPYGSVYDERWCLSINAPLGSLEEEL